MPTYAAGSDHFLKEPCREVLRLAARHSDHFFTDAETLQEMLHRYLAIGRWPEGKRIVLDFAVLMSGSVEPILAADVIRACGLADGRAVRSGARLAARDLLHAAVMLRVEGGGVRIVTADRDFDELASEGIERLDPTDHGTWGEDVTRGSSTPPNLPEG